MLSLRFPVVLTDGARLRKFRGSDSVTHLCIGVIEPPVGLFFLLLVLDWPKIGPFCSTDNEQFRLSSLPMPVPQVAIVGRPNVGKSSLFNWLARRRLAIVDDYSGVTRDRMTTLIEANDRYFELIDTGGMGVEDEDNLTADVRQQIELCIV